MEVFELEMRHDGFIDEAIRGIDIFETTFLQVGRLSYNLQTLGES